MRTFETKLCSSLWNSKQRKKICQNLPTTNTKEKKIKDNKPCILAVLRTYSPSFRHKISTMMGTSNAILKLKTTNWWLEIYPPDVGFQSSLLPSMAVHIAY